MAFKAIHLQRRQKILVGQLRQPGIFAADADELFNVVIPRRDVSVAYRPVSSYAFSGVGFKIQVAQAETMPRPHQRLAAGLIAAHPVEWLDLVIRMVAVFDEKMLGVLFEIEDVFLNEILFLILDGQFVAVRQFPRVFIGRRVILDMFDVAASFEHQRLQSFFGQLLGRPSA